MNKLILIPTICCCIACASYAAYETTADGLTWKYEIHDGKAEIVCNESSVARGTYPNITYVTVYTASISTNTEGMVTIPDCLGGCSVVSVGHDALRNCRKITSLVLPHSITNIGTWTWAGGNSYGGAFAGCIGLEEIHVDNLGMMCNIIFQHPDDNPFYYSPNADLYVAGILTTKANIPEGFTDINDYAFNNWRGLTKVVLPNSVTNIGKEAFCQCSGLKEANFHASIVRIGESAFAGCDFSKVSIPSTVMEIGEHAFYGVRNLELAKLNFGRDVTSIVGVSLVTNLVITAEIGALPWYISSFTNLTSIVIPESVTNISQNTFTQCTRLQTEWIKTIAHLSANGIVAESQYNLTDYVSNHAIATVTVDSDTDIDKFVLENGKVFDCAIRVVNTASTAIHITLPRGYVYESFVGASPLIIPARSTNMLTITRTGDRTFLVSRRQLQEIGQ